MESLRRHRILVTGIAVIVILVGAAGTAVARTRPTNFSIVRSAKAQADGCLPRAAGAVSIYSLGPVEVMHVDVSGLAPSTEYDLFVTQLPNAPFGVSWYQGDIETDKTGHGSETYIGRFNTETFAVAPGVGPAPVIHDQGQFVDADTNPTFGPIHTYHLGIWFNSTKDAVSAGCSAAVTPFNGDHDAGIQVLSTRNFPDLSGPLEQVH
jgi:hypothetical protein